MSKETTDLVIVMTKGIYDEVSSVGLTLANGAITSGKKVALFLTSSAIDLVRNNGINHTQVHPMESLRDLLPGSGYVRGSLHDDELDERWRRDDGRAARE